MGITKKTLSGPKTGLTITENVQKGMKKDERVENTVIPQLKHNIPAWKSEKTVYEGEKQRTEDQSGNSSELCSFSH